MRRGGRVSETTSKTISVVGGWRRIREGSYTESDRENLDLWKAMTVTHRCFTLENPVFFFAKSTQIRGQRSLKSSWTIPGRSEEHLCSLSDSRVVLLQT